MLLCQNNSEIGELIFMRDGCLLSSILERKFCCQNVLIWTKLSYLTCELEEAIPCCRIVLDVGVKNVSWVERREKDRAGVGVVACEQLVGVFVALVSNELDLPSHLSAISLIFFTQGVTEPLLPGDILLFA